MRGIAWFITAAAAVSCSSSEPKQKFTIPKTVCGVAAPSDAFSRLLPESGKKLTVDEHGTLADGNVTCGINVDKNNMVLVVNMERIGTDASARGVLVDRLSIWQQKSAENGTIAYVDHAAASLIKCRGAGIEEEDISTFIKVLNPGRPDESAMKDMISGYTAALKKKQPCTPES
ncbi:hypothetical protein AB0F77_19685 [Streptomyces sp. NPDC026672]|uniref:hypothetical protein n=1 Tax=unclassified Streptomyces TaxID=2593676 RepID=UPI0034039DF8